jgi:hypothetical protein
MESPAENPTGATPPAPRDEAAEQDAPRRPAPIADHRFQRPTVSPVATDGRPAPSGG